MTAKTLRKARAAARRLITQDFHEDEFSPLLDPEGDDRIRDDVILVAKALLAATEAPTNG